jgi:hypothetical protein
MSLFPLLIAGAQPSALPPPSPPGLPRPGTEWFDRERANYIERLRRDCMSERGIAIAVESWARWHATSDARTRREHAARQELGEAALTAPIDLERLERALAADADNQLQWRREHNANAMAVMRRLSPADRVVYARRLTVMMPAVAPRTCPARPG